MTWERLPVVLRILDNENRLLERADQKAISLLSILGVFMVFFIVYYRVIPITPFTAIIMVAYFSFALLAILNLIMAVRPRIRPVEENEPSGEEKAPPCEPAFFMGICKFPTLSAYRQCLEDMTRDEATTVAVYTRQIFSLAQINALKYKYVQRGVLFVVVTLAIELLMIVYLFIFYMGEGVMPPIFR